MRSSGSPSSVLSDLAADGVVYAEVRFAPEQHMEAGLRLDEVLAAVLTGFERGAADTDLTIHTICSAMRTAAHSMEIARLAIEHRDRGVVGFDIAGAEEGFPPTRHLDAFQLVMRENFHATIHAGEAFGLPSIWEALQYCGAARLGHGVRIVDDITGDPGDEQLGPPRRPTCATAASRSSCVRRRTSTPVSAASIAEHPIGMLRRLRFRITVNTDNRLMSDTSMTKEFAQLHDAFGWGLADMEWITINSMKSAFAPFPERLRIINGLIKPRYALLNAEHSMGAL